MYAHTYFDLFPPFPRRPFVFVAMSFDDQFTPRYRDVIDPAIRRFKTKDNVQLQPRRIDSRTIGDSILTEILQGIGQDTLVLADISTIGYLGKTAVRNANVLYEVGLAHAVRPAVEVLLFRSDNDLPLPFDVANIRVNSYSPDTNPAGARDTIASAIANAVNEGALACGLGVERALRQMDITAFHLLLECTRVGPLVPASPQALGSVLANIDRQRAIDRLLQIGAIEIQWPKIDPTLAKESLDKPYHELTRYGITELGRQVLVRWVEVSTGDMTAEQIAELESQLARLYDANAK